METNTAKKTLRIYSILFLVLAAIDAIQLVGSWLAGDFNAALLAEVYGVSRTMTLTIILVILAIYALVLLCKLYMGVKGLNRANGVGSGTGHITVGKIALVCCVILLAAEAISLLTNLSGAGIKNWLDIASPLASCLIAGGYLKAAKAVG